MWFMNIGIKKQAGSNPAARKEEKMNIHGFNKSTLLDYPGIWQPPYLGGCNLRVPFLP